MGELSSVHTPRPRVIRSLIKQLDLESEISQKCERTYQRSKSQVLEVTENIREAGSGGWFVRRLRCRLSDYQGYSDYRRGYRGERDCESGGVDVGFLN